MVGFEKKRWGLECFHAEVIKFEGGVWNVSGRGLSTNTAK